MREQGGERKARKNTSLEGEEERGRRGRNSVVLVN